MDGSGFCEAPLLAAAQCAGGEGDGGQRDAAAGGDTAAGHLPLRVVLAARAMAASAVAAGLWLADAQGTARAVPRELECGTRTGRSARPPRTPSCAPCPTRHCIAAIGGTPRTSVRR